MMLRNIALIILIVLAALLLFAVLSTPSSENGPEEGETTFNVLEVGRAGSYGYAVINSRGSPSVSLQSYESTPLKKVTVLNESGSMGAKQLDSFISQLKDLEQYGFTTEVSDERVLGEGIFIVPSGAMPSYVLDDLLFNATDSIIVYVGKSDLVLRQGVKKDDWYSRLDESQRARIVLYNTTPEEFIEAKQSLFQDVLINSWAVESSRNLTLTEAGKHTATIKMGSSEYLRIIYTVGNKKGLIDSIAMPSSGIPLEPEPSSIFTWEKATLEFSLNKTNGTAEFGVWKDGTETYRESLMRVSEENFFHRRLGFTEPGDHVLKVMDNSGMIGGGVMHVKDLKVSYIGSMGVSYLFNVTVDGKPLDNEYATVNLGNSTVKKSFIISDGILTVPARLEQGSNTFNIALLGGTRKVDVVYSQEGLLDIYIKYGIPGILIVLVVYFGARMSRRPVYVLRVGEVAGEIRKDVKMPAQKAMEAFRSIRSELGIGKSPITAHEFSVALKRHVTDGADVTEGNVEEMLARLVKLGYLQHHKQYYQLKGEGDARRNAVARMVRDCLIKAGLAFKTKGKRFLTEHFEIGFFGEKFSKKAIVVIEDQNELDSIYRSLGRKQLAELKIKVSNGMLQFVTIDRLEDVL